MTRFLILTLVAALAALSLIGCGNPQIYSPIQIGLCEGPRESLRGVPYTKNSQAACAVAISPFDLSIWHQAPMNSYKSRGARTAELGCRPLTAAVDNCSYCGPLGNSTSLMLNFDPTVFNSASQIRRAVLSVYSPGQPRELSEGYLRGRLSVGDTLTSLARQRTVVPDMGKDAPGGWVLYDVTFFVARAINEHRNSIHFEISMPCQTPATNQVTVGVNHNEPQLVVEYN